MWRSHLSIVVIGAAWSMCVTASAQQQSSDEALRRFVEQPTSCARLFGGAISGDLSDADWAAQLAAAIPGGAKAQPAQLERVIAECRTEIWMREQNPTANVRSTQASKSSP